MFDGLDERGTCTSETSRLQVERRVDGLAPSPSAITHAVESQAPASLGVEAGEFLDRRVQ